MVRRGLAPSRVAAQRLIEAGSVTVAGAPAEKAARLVGPGEAVVVAGPGPRYVGRGGDKLAAALGRFAVAAGGRVALDVGASTGGFTDCLLQHGATRVVAVDVGRGQLHRRLLVDPRVVSMERTNVRDLGPGDLPGAPFELVVVDVSFISLRTVAPALVTLASPGADIVALVKPQFEAGRSEAGAGRGVVRDPTVWARVLEEVGSAWQDLGVGMMGVMPSPLRGADGNVEYLAHLVPGGVGPSGVRALAAAAVAEATSPGPGAAPGAGTGVATGAGDGVPGVGGS